MKKWIFLLICAPIVLALLYVIVNILYAKMTYFDPPKIISYPQDGVQILPDSTEFSCLIWNVGYAGLGAETDFFYDGGKMVRPTKELKDKYLGGITNFLKNQKTDFVLLQEVDSHSRRSYYTDEVSAISGALVQNKYTPFKHFALNYNVQFVPQPWLNPMGKVESGLLTLSQLPAEKIERHQLPGAFGFPKQLYFLRRCLLATQYPLSNGKKLIIINLHNSAYDEDGTLKKQEMDYLKKYLLAEYAAGNYVVCGGDWNQCPPNFVYDELAQGKDGDYVQTNVDTASLEHWQWAFDATTPTNRKNDKPYNPQTTFVTLIDFFLVSPNVEVVECKGIANGFAFSDHQPVLLRFKIKGKR